ncbi:hypothetical protein CISG_07077 [Coccidioides immitis RMSCC 3703]|uniref:Ribosome biogenesis protein NOP53 n=2 Tax=Coccidioides immitis TaxID=5501 RepID=A0A0J8TWE2_COCIT|nr:hypothetical protein CIRG_00787 [Coccidioides immitis RMSCC 2394]KMU78237.1 hypothetical protein CISG_07077 [Coccidioides immitis RMSCC 3703]
MATNIEAPHQYNQPSRKGKKAWRKNVDVSEVQEGLRLLREEEIQGGVLAEKPSGDLFTIDKLGSNEIAKRPPKASRPLKADEILGLRSAINAVDSRKRPNPKVTDGIVEPKSKRTRRDWVTKEEWLRLKKVAAEANLLNQDVQQGASYDPWEDNPSAPTPEDNLDFIPKTKPKVAPATLKRPPISLAANGKPIPSVKTPDAGISYNPTFEDWDKLLTEEGNKEVEAEKQRLQEEKAEQERQTRIEAAKNENDEAKSDDESAWEGFESEYEAPEGLKKKRPERKTKAQRNKIKRRKEVERKAKWEAKMKKREEQASQIKAILNAVKENEEARKLKEKEAESSEEGDDRVLRKRSFGGKHLVPEKPLEIVLPDELQDSLRLLKPEGNLLGDRFRNLLVQGKLETRKPVSQPKKAKRTYTEKWSHKDFKI